eukprot:5032591-Lingulodinium_polyedra.AAC.1
MGWAHALAFCQRVSESAADEAGLAVAQRIRDGAPAPDVAHGAHLVYVDNFVSVATSEALANPQLELVVSALRKRGLPVHEVEVAATHAT